MLSSDLVHNFTLFKSLDSVKLKKPISAAADINFLIFSQGCKQRQISLSQIVSSNLLETRFFAEIKNCL